MARRRRRRKGEVASLRFRILVVCLVIGAGVVLVGAAAAFRLANAGRDLQAAQDLLEDAGQLVEQGRLAEGRAKLVEANARLADARSSLHNHPELDVLTRVPIVGSNLAEVRDTVSLAAKISSGGLRILVAAEPLEGPDGRLEVPLRAGSIPLGAVRAALTETALLAAALPEPDEVKKRDFLVGPVKEAHDELYEQAERRRVQLQVLTDALTLVQDMAGGSGDRFYMIAVANTAEMRGSGGMILNFGGLLGRAGKFELTDFARIDYLPLRNAVEKEFIPDLPADYLRRWEGFEPIQRWRNSNLGADFTLIGPVLEGMWGTATGTAIDGVIQIDPQGLAAVVEGIGPVEVPGIGTVDKDNLVPLVLNEAYSRFPGIEERSDVLEDVAEAVFEKLVTGSYESLRPLATALVKAVDARHIIMHTRAAAPTAAIEAFGADGALPARDGPDYVHLTVQNVSANKLDYYVDTALSLTGQRLPGELGQVQAEVVVTNGAAPGVRRPQYVYGPFDSSQEAGLYRGVVSLYLPRGATLVGTSGDAPRDPPITVSEDGRPVVSYTVDLPAGASHRIVLDLELAPRPDAPYELIAVPSPRVRPTTLRTDLDLGGARLTEDVVLDRTWVLGQAGARAQVAGGSAEEASGGPRTYGMLRRSWLQARADDQYETG
jgi:hypothetical protein